MQLGRDLRSESKVRGGRLNPGKRASLISAAAVALALGLVGFALWQPPKDSLIFLACVGFVCVIVIARVPLAAVGVGSIALFCLTASWDEIFILGIEARQFFLILGLVLLIPTLDLRRLPPVPWWLHAYGLSAVVVTCLRAISPIADSYLEGRYATSEAGQALGTRPGNLESLLSLLFNNYAIPIIIVLACMYLPKALKLLIAAFVIGATLSSFAGILGYYGHPWLLNLFGTSVVPEGTRALGLTSHPLRLATSQVMSIGLGSWLAFQSHPGLRWCGRLSVPALILGLYAAGSRGGLVAGFLALVLSMCLLPVVRRRIHVAFSGLTAVLLGLYLLFPSAVSGAFDSTRIRENYTTIVSDTGRAEVLAQGLRDFYTSPIFGIGVRFIAEAHTLYIGVLAAGGIILAAGFLLFNVGSINTCVQALKVDRSLAGVLLATLVATLVYWTVADMIQTATVASVYGFVIALWWQGQRDATASSQRAAGDGDAMDRPDGQSAAVTRASPA